MVVQKIKVREYMQSIRFNLERLRMSELSYSDNVVISLSMLNQWTQRLTNEPTD